MADFQTMVCKPIWVIDLKTLFPQEILERVMDPADDINIREVNASGNAGASLEAHLAGRPDAKVVLVYTGQGLEESTHEALAVSFQTLLDTLRVKNDPDRLHFLASPSMDQAVISLKEANFLNGQSHVLARDLNLASAALDIGTPTIVFIPREELEDMPHAKRNALESTSGVVTVPGFFWQFVERTRKSIPSLTTAPEPA